MAEAGENLKGYYYISTKDYEIYYTVPTSNKVHQQRIAYGNAFSSRKSAELVLTRIIKYMQNLSKKEAK